MIVLITAHDIETGVKGDCDRCAVAKALRKERGFGTAKVGNGMTIADRENYTHDAAVANWIIRYDQGEPVSPVRLSIDHAKRLIGMVR